jgi:hypothetical protein
MRAHTTDHGDENRRRRVRPHSAHNSRRRVSPNCVISIHT